MTTLQEMIEEACKQTEDSEYEVHFRNTYSGRGMYGRQCMGITGSHKACMQVIGQVIKELTPWTTEDRPRGELDFRDSVDTLLDHDTDSMGRGIILYWPQLPSIDSAEELSDREG
jgi:hypothetical protein